MAVARIVKVPIDTDTYDKVRAHLGIVDTPPPGGVLHVAAVDDDGQLRIFEVWDSREQAEAWAEKVAAAREEAGVGGAPPTIEYLEVHSVLTR